MDMRIPIKFLKSERIQNFGFKEVNPPRCPQPGLLCDHIGTKYHNYKPRKQGRSQYKYYGHALYHKGELRIANVADMLGLPYNT